MLPPGAPPSLSSTGSISTNSYSGPPILLIAEVKVVRVRFAVTTTKILATNGQRIVASLLTSVVGFSIVVLDFLDKDQVGATKVVDDMVGNVDQVSRASPEVLDIVRADGQTAAVSAGDKCSRWRKSRLNGLDNVQCS